MAGKMRSGFGEAAKAVAKQKQGFVPPAGKLNYLSMKDGDIVYVRFLDDEIITAKFYEWIVNNQGSTSEFICAPDLYQYDPDWTGRDWVQQYTSETPGIGWAKKFKSDQLVVPKLAERTVGMAVEREQVKGPDGTPVKPPQYQDALEEIEGDDGEKHVGLHFMLVRQALSNFWDQMVGFHGLYGTICDRDYRIERKGDGLKTTYQAIPLTPDVGWQYGDNDTPSPSLLALQALYGYGVELDKEKGVVSLPEGEVFAATTYTWENRYLYAPTTVAQWCERRASEDFAKFWLDPNAEHLKDLKDKPAGVTAEALIATRPADPRQAAAAAAPTPPPSTPAPTPAAASAPAEPASGDRFEQMRAEMAKKQAGLGAPAATT